MHNTQASMPASASGYSIACDIACDRGCGFRRSNDGAVRTHRGACPRGWDTGLDCDKQIKHDQRASHKALCRRRTVSCTWGCAAPQLRSQDVTANYHAFVCPKRPVLCQYCQGMFAHNILKEHIAIVCPQRPVACKWCLDRHPFRLYPAMSQNCRQKLTDPVTLNGQTLQLHPYAQGPVYVSQQGSDDPVFIKMPGALLARERPTSLSSNRTCDLHVKWAGRSCSLQTKYDHNKDSFCVSVDAPQRFTTPGLKAQLLAGNGSLLQKWGPEHANLQLDPDQHSVLFQISAIDRIAIDGGDHVFLQLGPFAAPPGTSAPVSGAGVSASESSTLVSGTSAPGVMPCRLL
ncbi:MAG: hypothetical protein OXC07_01535 [Kistimonas sp.]|nr:hypothetical protein [Kistimonas sp.]